MHRKPVRRVRNYRRNNGSLSLFIFVCVLCIAYVLKGKEFIQAVNLDELTNKWMNTTLNNNKKTEKVQTDSKQPLYDMPCMQANIAKILTYTLLLDIQDIKESENEIWYKKYYDKLQREKDFNFLKIEDALKPITYAQLGELLDAALGEGYSLSVQVGDEYKNKEVTLNKFLSIYEKALESTGKSIHLGTRDLVVIATPANSQELDAWKVATDAGEYNFEGLVMDPLVSKTVTAIVKDSHILGINKIVSNTSTINKCYIADVLEQDAIVQIGDIKMTYPNEVLKEEQKGTICDLTLSEGKITAYQIQTNKNRDTLLRITDKYIELEEAGRFSYDQVLIYDFTQEGSYKKLSQVASGTQVEYICKDNKIESLNVVDRDKKDQVRVVLSGEKLGDFIHKEVCLISDQEYDILYNGTRQVLAKGQEWKAGSFPWEEGCNKVVIEPKGDSLIKVLSSTRQSGHPKYKGSLEIYKEGKEQYIVVNSLPTDDYVAAVVSSEMPSVYGKEAAKVQAVAVRSYAKMQQNNSKYVEYGAQLDDTTDTQVYNNVMPDTIAYEAAKETAGQVLLYNGSIISSKFFSTSCGYTANFGEVWSSGEVFPTNTPVYLVARQQYVGDRVVNNLSDEKDAYTFFKLTDKDINAFDNHSPWFRWSVNLNSGEVNDVINTSIGRLSKLYPDLVKVFGNNKTWEKAEVDTVGNVKDLKVKKRGQGGNIMELVVVGEKHTVKISTEYLIRNLLSSTSKTNIIVKRMDDSKISHLTMLPSAFFSMDIAYDEQDNLKKLSIYGGGFGHGVGMSQEGVKGMVDRGYTYREILGHYYPQAKIEEQK